MKVIFIEDVPDVANAGETKEVADGYGRNYLLPRKLAVLANSQGAAVLESQLKKIAQKRAQAEAEMAEIAGKLSGVEITLKAKVGAKDRLYGSITSADIADGLSSQAGSIVDKRKIELAEPIRQLGSYEVTVRFTHDIVAAVRVAVVADEAAAEPEEPAAEKKKRKKVKEEVEAKAEQEAEETIEETVEEGSGESAEAEDRVALAEDKVEEAEDKVAPTEDSVEEPEDEVAPAEDKVEEAGEKEAA